MRYHLDDPVTVAGITFRAVCHITGHTLVNARMTNGTRQKTPVAFTVDGPFGKAVLDPDGQLLDEGLLKTLQAALPELTGRE